MAQIRIGNILSDPIPLLSGVAQGGILSPLLFLIFINDIPEPEHGVHNVIFADDVTQVITVPNQNSRALARKVTRETTKINNYE